MRDMIQGIAFIKGICLVYEEKSTIKAKKFVKL